MVEVNEFCLNAWTEYIYGADPNDPGGVGAYRYVSGAFLVTGEPWLWEVNIWCIYCYIGPADEIGDTTPIEAFKINTIMGFNTAKSAKYEPDERKGEETRSIVLANYRDHTNILIQYKPGDLP